MTAHWPPCCYAEQRTGRSRSRSRSPAGRPVPPCRQRSVSYAAPAAAAYSPTSSAPQPPSPAHRPASHPDQRRSSSPPYDAPSADDFQLPLPPFPFSDQRRPASSQAREEPLAENQLYAQHHPSAVLQYWTAYQPSAEYQPSAAYQLQRHSSLTALQPLPQHQPSVENQPSVAYQLLFEQRRLSSAAYQPSMAQQSFAEYQPSVAGDEPAADNLPLVCSAAYQMLQERRDSVAVYRQGYQPANELRAGLPWLPPSFDQGRSSSSRNSGPLAEYRPWPSSSLPSSPGDEEEEEEEEEADLLDDQPSERAPVNQVLARNAFQATMAYEAPRLPLPLVAIPAPAHWPATSYEQPAAASTATTTRSATLHHHQPPSSYRPPASYGLVPAQSAAPKLHHQPLSFRPMGSSGLAAAASQPAAYDLPYRPPAGAASYRPVAHQSSAHRY